MGELTERVEGNALHRGAGVDGTESVRTDAGLALAGDGRSRWPFPMALVSLLDVSLSFGGAPLLDRVNLQIDRGERVCLVGRNGAGKSTLMKVISGELQPDDGQVIRQAGAAFSMLRQEVPVGLEGTVRQVVEGEGGSYEEHNDWERHDRVERLLEQMGLPTEDAFASLSAGQKRRVLLARGLVEAPQMLLLDEPTNHLDLESIQWLEEFLLEWGGALLFVTHDRAFLRKLATRIVEVDRGQLVGWACDYDTFLVRKQAVLEAEEVQRAQFDKKLAQEEEWIRRGVKAQRSRAQNRIHALEKMRAERAARRERSGNAKLTAQESDRSGFKVIECADTGFWYQDESRWIVRDLTMRIERGDKIGIVGPNGAGKTTLLRLLLGQLTPTAGTIEQGTRLEIVYYDQLRAQLDETMRVQDAVADGNATVTINGRTRHVISYLEDFLFEPARARTPIKALSGGERNRLMLARLFTKPCNVLVLDEPTNDLDAETLELLEDLLVEYCGTLLLVSHDRAFLNEVCTSLLVFEGEGRVTEYLGGYDDWQKEKAAKAAAAEQQRLREKERANRAAEEAAAAAAGKTAKPKKLSNKERAELEALPARIEKLETEQSQLTAQLGDAEFFKKGGAEVSKATARLETIEKELAVAYARWSELEG
jgi:ATP-binding cassette subfamily F protein uup